MQMYISKKVLNNYGIQELGEYNSKNIMVFQNDIEQSILDKQMLALIGKPGTGKTELFKRVRGKLEKTHEFIYVKNYKKEAIGAGAIIEAVFEDLKIGEAKRRSLEARSRQFVRIIGEKHVNEGLNFVIVIEEAHRLNIDFLRTLKEMREAEYAGISPLFSVVLIGHPLIIYKLQQREETNWRTRSLYLTEQNGWFDFDERMEYLKVKYGSAIKIEARRRIATHCRLPLEMDNFVRIKMEEGMLAGKKILDDDIVRPTVQEVWDMIKAENPEAISYRILAKEMGLNSHSTVQRILSGHGTKKQETQAVKALMKISNKLSDERIEHREAI